MHAIQGISRPPLPAGDREFLPIHRRKRSWKACRCLLGASTEGIERRDALKVHLESKGIQALIYYGMHLHLQPVAKHYGFQRGDFPNAKRQANRVLELPTIVPWLRR